MFTFARFPCWEFNRESPEGYRTRAEEASVRCCVCWLQNEPHGRGWLGQAGFVQRDQMAPSLFGVGLVVNGPGGSGGHIRDAPAVQRSVHLDSSRRESFL